MPTGYAAPIVPDDLPDGPGLRRDDRSACESNDIVKGKFLSDDGQLAHDRHRARPQGRAGEGAQGRHRRASTSSVNEVLAAAGLTAKLTGAPVMQLEIRNAVERDQIVYNGLGLLFGAADRRHLLPPRLADAGRRAAAGARGRCGRWGCSAGLGFKLNLFLNVMTPLIMVMGFADSMQMVSAIRIRLREGDTSYQAVRFAVRVVGPACVLAHGVALLSFLALLFSESGLIRTFGMAGALAVCISFVAVILVLPIARRAC